MQWLDIGRSKRTEPLTIQVGEQGSTVQFTIAGRGAKSQSDPQNARYYDRSPCGLIGYRVAPEVTVPTALPTRLKCFFTVVTFDRIPVSKQDA